MKLPDRLQTIVDLVPKNSKVIDIGTDHAYVPIYLYLNNITHNITATDISSNVLKQTYNNLKKYNLEDKIKLIQSNGFKNVLEPFDLAVIAGMGTHTIIDILKTKNLPKTLIISSNNDHHILREYLNSINYTLSKEIAILDNNKYYLIMYYTFGKENLTKEEILFGKSNNIEYFNYLSNLYSKYPKYRKYLELLEKYRSRL